MLQEFFDTIIAFTVNGANNLAFAIMNNLWFLLISAGALCSIVIALKEEAQSTVTEDQFII